MEIIETFVEGKVPDPDRCEDAIYIDNNFVAVIDGATSADKVSDDGRSPGRIASELIVSAMHKLDPVINAVQANGILDGTILDWYRSRGILSQAQQDVERRVIASAVIFSACRREIWMIGDCQALVDEEHLTNIKLTDTLTEEVRAFVIESELAEGSTVDDLLQDDTGRMVIDDLIRRQRTFQNRGLGSRYDYFVLDGFLPVPPPVIVHPVPMGTLNVVLASDGYPQLHPTLRESEAALHAILRNDPLLFIRNRSTKGAYPGNRSFDDRAYIRLSLHDHR